jgi:hypothetical protein
MNVALNFEVKMENSLTKNHGNKGRALRELVTISIVVAIVFVAAKRSTSRKGLWAPWSLKMEMYMPGHRTEG